jgi:hypothetical protein
MGAYYQDSEHKSVNATGQRWLSMSALGQKADIGPGPRHVCFTPKSGHR